MGVTLRVAVGTAFALAVTCGLEGSANTPGPLERVDGGATEVSRAPKPTVGLCAIPSSSPLLLCSSHSSSFAFLGTGCLSLELWPHRGILEDSLAFCKVILSFMVH